MCHATGMDGLGDLTGTVLYTSGCHSGLTVPAADGKPVDLPELMASKEVVAFIGNTGYAWGLREGKGMTENLMELLSEELLKNASISVGKAMSTAKAAVRLLLRRADVYDEKVLHELTLFGIPTLPGGDQPERPDGAGKAGRCRKWKAPTGACAVGICVRKRLCPPVPAPGVHLPFRRA